MPSREYLDRKYPPGSIDRRVYRFNSNYSRAGLTVTALLAIRDYQDNKCAMCRQSLDIVPWEIDHRVPIASGGVNTSGNLQLACVTCNRGKGVMTTAAFIEHCKIVAYNNVCAT